MTTTEIANALVRLCASGQFHEASQTLLANDVVSIEASGPPETREIQGLDAVLKKGEWWVNNHEVHSSTVEGPLVAGNHFAVTFKMDVTNKPSGQRFLMEEVAIYEVKNGKVVREQFFYSM